MEHNNRCFSQCCLACVSGALAFTVKLLKKKKKEGCEGIYIYMKGLFEFELTANNEGLDSTNINRICVFVSDEQKTMIEKIKLKLFSKNGVDNLSDYLLKKINEDINNK
jgi:hypothetical protein